MPFSTAGMNWFGIVPPKTSSTNSKPAAARERLDAQEHLAELPGAAGLLLVAVVALGRPRDRLAVRDLGRARLDLHAVALGHALVITRRCSSPMPYSTVSLTEVLCRRARRDPRPRACAAPRRASARRRGARARSRRRTSAAGTPAASGGSGPRRANRAARRRSASPRSSRPRRCRRHRLRHLRVLLALHAEQVRELARASCRRR